jgi:hypothetical protein
MWLRQTHSLASNFTELKAAQFLCVKIVQNSVYVNRS